MTLPILDNILLHLLAKTIFRKTIWFETQNQERDKL